MHAGATSKLYAVLFTLKCVCEVYRKLFICRMKIGSKMKHCIVQMMITAPRFTGQSHTMTSQISSHFSANNTFFYVFCDSLADHLNSESTACMGVNLTGM